jgi:RNA polymerase sigma factor (sigma-70 family)
MSMTDADLLRRFVEDHHEDAFSELVRRRIDLVYAAALRQLGGDAHRAQDITQQVFIDLARKARALTSHPSLLAWLYTSTHYAALKSIRTENRRQRREVEAHAMENLTASSANTTQWEQLRPVLDHAMHELTDRERQIVLLRFFDQQSFAAIGAAIGLTENAAQKCAERALNRLHARLAKRGVTSTASALGVALANQAVAVSAPAGLAASVTTAALSGAAAIGFGSSAATLLFMSTSKTALSLAAAGVLTVGFAVYQSREADAARAEQASLQREQTTLRERRAALERELRAAEQPRPAAVASSPAVAITTDDALSPRSGTTSSAQPERALQQFLGNHRELTRLRQEADRLFFKADNEAYLRSIGVTPEQIDQLANWVAEKTDTQLRMAANGQTYTPSQDSGAQLRALIGDAAAERWRQNEKSGMKFATQMVNHLATGQFYTDEPFTLDQADQLAAIMVTYHEPGARPFNNGRLMTWRDEFTGLGVIGWDNVLRDAERILSARQMDSLRAFAARGRNTALVSLVEKQSSGKGAK